MGKSTHFFGQPLYFQVIKLLDKSTVLNKSRQNGGEQYVKSFDGWTHLVVMLYAVIMQKGLTRRRSFSGLATMVRITLMCYVDFYSLFNHREKDWESLLAATSETPPQPPLFG